MNNATGVHQRDLVLGIDEAGRGPALGPMVLAAVALDPTASAHLTALGVTDSKAFGSGVQAHARRVALVVEIERAATFVAVEVCDVATIDNYVARRRLNVLERERAVCLIRRGPQCGRIVADGATLFAPLKAVYPQLEAHDGGESIHVAVAAASVCAKVRRDELFACVEQRYLATHGPIAGAGYGEGSQSWVNNFLEKFGELPPEVRASWGWRTSATLFRVGTAPAQQMTLF